MVIAAGAPWFVTLLGRDARISSLLTLAVDLSLAVRTLRRPDWASARLANSRVHKDAERTNSASPA